MSWEVAIGVAAILAAAIYTAWQVHVIRRTSSVDRVIRFHEALTTGEVVAARNRFTTLMWAVGEAFQPGSCWQPSFSELLGSSWHLPSAGSSESRGRLDLYGDVPVETVPLQDLYLVLWQFERVAGAWSQGLLDEGLLLELIGPHAAWWNELLGRVSDSDTIHRRALRELAGDVIRLRPELEGWAQADFGSDARP